jgi:hypothetical protein
MLLTGLISSYVSMPGETQKMDVKLKVNCRVQENELLIQYWLQNHGNRPLLAYDGAPGLPLGSQWPNLDDQIYVSAVNGQVELKRINPPQPPGKLINRAFVPPMSQVGPGEQRDVRFRLKLPLLERSQYTPDFPGAQYQDRTARTIRLGIGYFVKNDNTQLQPFPENPNAFRVRGPHGNQMFVYDSCNLEVPVRVRTDDQFQRL